nr:ATP-dependent DNA helicase CHL1 [Ipomoea batatas]
MNKLESSIGLARNLIYAIPLLITAHESMVNSNLSSIVPRMCSRAMAGCINVYCVERLSKDVQVGFRVRLFNLPKKKNILKDLQLAFKGFPGIVNIIPVVSGNSKTRDPVCKGIAFIDLKSEDGAQRFVQTFSGQSIYFGKVQKNIKCEMMSSTSTKLRNAHSDDETSYDPSEPDSDEELEADFEIDAHTSDSWEENDSTEYDAEVEHTSAQMDDYDEDMETDSGDEQDNAMEGSATNVSFSTVQKKVVVSEKKKKAKRKKETTPKLNIPGSARRLKIRDKALLTGVLTKYGLNTAEGKPAKLETHRSEYAA